MRLRFTKRQGLKLDDDTRRALGHGVAVDRHDPSLTSTVRRERHDQSYVPRGWRVEDGKLRQNAKPWVELTPDDVAMVAAIRRVVDLVLIKSTPPLPRAEIERLKAAVAAAPTEDERARIASSRQVYRADPDTLAGLRRAYEAIHGVPWGNVWRWHLANQLRLHVRHREQRRRGMEVDDTTTVDGKTVPVSAQDGAEILAHVREWCPTPPWLTAEMLDALLPTVNLGGKGGRGKSGRSPEQAVTWLVRQQGRQGRGGNSKG